MEHFHARMLAVSLAGHDKGKRCVVLAEETNGCYVVDGRLRLLGNPKWKNQKHLQLIKHLPEDLLTEMAQIENDGDVRRILAAYAGEMKNPAANEQDNNPAAQEQM